MTWYSGTTHASDAFERVRESLMNAGQSEQEIQTGKVRSLTVIG